MPEKLVADRMRVAGASDTEVRLLLTFIAAMDRARDADRLWFASADLYDAAAWVFDPAAVIRHSLLDLADALRRFGVSQRHRADAGAWRTIAEALADAQRAPPVHAAVFEGKGDVRELLRALQTTTQTGSDLLPLLRGPKIGPMWVRMLAFRSRRRSAASTRCRSQSTCKSAS